ncbi:conserved hypothetical protein [Vibrio rotiferianus]|nr:conserved hypothetical protein [Vibrio rotiferianus]CAH1556677.1 conserved hypothetical protein [Vibrio rotiferianus]
MHNNEQKIIKTTYLVNIQKDNKKLIKQLLINERVNVKLMLVSNYSIFYKIHPFTKSIETRLWYQNQHFEYLDI